MKYHLGTSFDRPTSAGKQVHLSLLANPSHLEAVNPIVLGKCRARQFYEDDPTGRATMPILLHGDGSFSGQVCCTHQQLNRAIFKHAMPASLTTLMHRS